MAEPWQHFYQSQRLRLSYWAWGDAAKPPLLLIHGFRDQSRSWDRIAEAFCDDYRVIVPDWRGHGDSQWTRGSTYPLTDLMLDLVALIDLVGGTWGGRVSVVAHSMGGRVTLMTAGTFPEKFERIVAIEGTGRPRPADQDATPTPRRLREWVERTRALETRTPHVYPTFQEAVDRVREVNRRLTPEMAEHLARWAARGIDGGYAWKYDPWLYADGGLEVSQEEHPVIWANIECPVLHIIGSDGARFRARVDGRPVESYFQHGSVVNAPDSGHWVHHDQTEFVVNAVRDFLGTPPVAAK